MGDSMQVSVIAFLLLFVGLLNAIIGAYVFWRNPRGRPHGAFAMMATTTALWTAGVTLTCYGPFNLVGARLAWAAGSLIPLATLSFVESFPSGNRSGRGCQILAYLAVPVALLAASPLLIAGVSIEGHTPRITYGPLHPILGAYVLGCFSYAAWVLVRRYRSSTGSLKLQAKHLLLALSIPIAVGTFTNLVLPLLFGTSEFGRYGPLFTLVMVLTIAHAIVRHRLMDVRVVIRRGAVYLAAFTVAGALLLALLVGSSALVHDEHQVPLREIGLALLVAVFFHPLKGLIQRAFDRYLYREPYDYQRTIRQASRALRGTIELPVLLGHVGTALDQPLRPEWHAVFLLDEDDGELVRVFLAGSASLPGRWPMTTALAERAGKDRKPVFRDELGLEAAAVLAEMEKLGTEVVVPLLEEERTIGLLAVGPKRSGDPYFSDDADLLSTLADQSSVAIRNAQTHQQVLEANEYIQKILATIESGVISVNTRGRVRLFNRAAEMMTGAPAGSLRGQPVGHLPAPLARLIEATLQDPDCRAQAELALPDAAGQIIPLMCSTAPLWGPQGTLVGAVAVVSDLSRLKELEQEKRRAERLAALESIASGLVHEIRNPLVAIKTFTQLLPSRGDDAAFRQDVARISDREISRIEDLLARFRTLAAPASQPMELVDVAQPLQATLDLLRAQMEERRIRLRYVADGVPRPVLGNASQLEQLFLNVCLNALEAMEPGGELTVRLADLCAAGGTTLLVEVSDTGTGIPEELLPNIFNPFVTTKARGSGLGLAICRSIADAHRTTLSARNNAGRPGSTFTIEFPVPTGPPAPVRA